MCSFHGQRAAGSASAQDQLASVKEWITTTARSIFTNVSLTKVCREIILPNNRLTGECARELREAESACCVTGPRHDGRHMSDVDSTACEFATCASVQVHANSHGCVNRNAAATPWEMSQCRDYGDRPCSYCCSITFLVFLIKLLVFVAAMWLRLVQKSPSNDIYFCVIILKNSTN